MSIHKMIELHPDVQGAANDALATAARHAMFCDLMCTSCADACMAEAMNMDQCIRMCLDCADACAATARMAVRRTGSDTQGLSRMLLTCVHLCEECAEECRRHSHAHCSLCAEMCEECARDCQAAVDTL